MLTAQRKGNLWVKFHCVPGVRRKMHMYTLTNSARHLLPYTFHNHCRMSEWFNFGQRLQKISNYTSEEFIFSQPMKIA